MQAQIAGTDFAHADLASARDTLLRERGVVAQRRLALLRALEQWMLAARDGTRREFAQFAGAHTTSIADADWRWLAETLDLEAAGVQRHSPALWLRAPLRLRDGDLDLRGVPDLIGLSPSSIDALVAIDGEIACWRVVGNRTISSMRRAHSVPATACSGCPATRPPGGCTPCARCCNAVPRPRGACDPDPAGVEIALNAARCGETRGLDGFPWQMDETALRALPKRLPLTAHDRATIARLEAGALPAILRELLAAMRTLDNCGEPAKGEQEGLDLIVRDWRHSMRPSGRLRRRGVVSCGG